jgi:protein-S-isoprenylcysteine O-methyltransferase Ste14
MNSEHQHQSSLGEEHPRGHLIQIVAGAMFVAVWVSDIFFHQFQELTSIVVWPFRVGLFLASLIFALYLFKGSHDAVFSGRGTIETSGVYARVRHPMYLGVLLVYLSLLLLTTSLVSVIPFIVAFFLYDWIAAYEERDLERRLGQEYADYIASVPRWIPKFF